MIVTEQQRRWWFATHPEYSWSRERTRAHGHSEEDHEDEETQKLSPEYVDASVDEALRYERDPVGIALLKSAKFWLGTEFASRTPADQYELLWGDEATEGGGYQPPDEAADDRWPQQLSDHRAAEPQTRGDGVEARIPWASAGPGGFLLAGTGSGWGTPAGAGGPDMPELTLLEKLQLAAERLIEVLRQNVPYPRRALPPFPGDHDSLLRRAFDPPKMPGIKDLVDISKQYADTFRHLIDSNETGPADKVVKALEDSAEAVDAVLDAARSGGTRRPPRLPPKGTPERAKIEAARTRGRDRKMAEELADIQAGGKGSGVWSEEELEGIRRTGDFPIDTVWHHDPTVANRPDLADDPKVVHPLRGGPKAHLRDGHQGNYQNPRK